MSISEAVFLGFSIIGGVAVFILGMSIMTDGLRQAAGDRLRAILSRATRNRYAGVTFGTSLGFLVHSSAATVMMVGFVNAGLMHLYSAIPLLMGASIGTTLSMQLISFRLTDYAFVAIAVGFVCQMAVPQLMVKHVGRALLGFGLLFLGLDFVGDSIQPYREQIAPWLARIDGTTWSGMFLGILIATAVTGIVQSSGATIGMLFAMITAGMFTSLEQVYPIVLGAHIGTSVTALLVSIGTNLEARRAAWANVFFQVFNVALAVVAVRFFVPLAVATSEDLVRQTANLHTAIMIAAAAVLLPVLPWCVPIVRRLAPVRGAEPQKSFLDREFLRTPERAICATVQELQRATDICRENLRLIEELYREDDRRNAKRLELNEAVINEVKGAVKAYLARLTRGYLSRRQALMVQYLTRGINDVERIGDHVHSLYAIRQRQRQNPSATFDLPTEKRYEEIRREAGKIIDAVARSLSPETPDFRAAADAIMKLRDRYDELSHQAKTEVNNRVASHDLHPMIGLYFSECVSAFDRIVKHCRMIAREEQQPFYRIKATKLEKEVEMG
jgi:phosphate:Na+ symporter